MENIKLLPILIKKYENKKYLKEQLTQEDCYGCEINAEKHDDLLTEILSDLTKLTSK